MYLKDKNKLIFACGMEHFPFIRGVIKLSLVLMNDYMKEFIHSATSVKELYMKEDGDQIALCGELDYLSVKKIEEVKNRVISLVKQSNEDTEEGFRFLPAESILSRLQISESKLRKVVTYALQEELLKFDEMKKKMLVVYTQERKLNIEYL